MTRPPATLLAKLNDGKFFYVEFYKRTNGAFRQMTARSGVFKDIVGAGRPYDPAKHDLMCVWDVKVAGYRNIPIAGITYLKHHSEEWGECNAVAA